MERIPRWALLAATSLTFVAAAACSSSEPTPEGASPPTAPGVSLPPTSVVEGGGTTTVVEAPVTFPPDANADQVVAELGPRLPMSDAERAYVVRDIGSDADLLGRLGDGVSPGTELFDEVTTIHQRCTVTVTQAPAFATSLNQQLGGNLSPEQLTCLTDGFAALSPEQLDGVFAGAFNPADPATADGTAPIAELATSCGVEVPAA